MSCSQDPESMVYAYNQFIVRHLEHILDHEDLYKQFLEQNSEFQGKGCTGCGQLYKSLYKCNQCDSSFCTYCTFGKKFCGICHSYICVECMKICQLCNTNPLCDNCYNGLVCS